MAIVAESFLPEINGVTNSVLRILEYLRATGHDAMVLAPSNPGGVPDHYRGFPVVTTPSLALPWYPSMRLSTATAWEVERLLGDYAPDVVHLASPAALGYRGVRAAAKLGIPSVAVYQTDIPTYAVRYGYAKAEALVWWHVRKLHNMATINLAPSSYTRDQLIAQGIARVSVWGRGVDTQRFHPARRDPALHAAWSPHHQRVVGYMGRLGAEKQVADLAVLANLPNTRLVIIGDGPLRAELAEKLPDAVFTGQKTGTDLARHLASLDLFVHPGELETFGQTIQEAKASGLPVVAPRRGGPIDLVDPSRTGWLYQPGDLDEMRRYVADLVGDDAKRAAFGRAARLSVEHRTWPAICGDLMRHYEEAVELGYPLRREQVG